MEHLIELLMQAARRELAANEPAASLPYLNQAVDLARTNSRERTEFEALEMLAKAHELIGDLAPAEQVLRTCLQRLEAVGGNDPATPRILTALGKVLLQRGDLAPAREYLNRSLLLSSGSLPGPERASSLEALGLIERQLGESANALTCFEEALRIRHALGDLVGTAGIHGNLGNLLTQLGRLDEAAEHLRQSIELYQRVPDSASGMAVAYNNLASLQMHQGEYAAAIENLEHAERHFRATGNRRNEARAMANRGLLHSFRGEGRQAEALLAKCISILEEIDDRLGLAMQLNNLSMTLRMSGRNREAVAAARRSIELRQSLGQMEGLSKPWFNVALGHLDMDEFEDAEIAAGEVRALAQRTESREILSETLILETRLALSRKNWDEALARAIEAESLAREGGYPRQMAEALRLQAEVHLERGAVDAARESLLESETIFRSLPDPLHLALCQVQLGRLFGRVGATEAAVDRLSSAAEVFSGLLNSHLEWRALFLLAEAEWPLSHAQALRTLERADRIAVETGRPELATVTAELRARLRQGSSDVSQPSSLVNGLLRLFGELHGAQGDEQWLGQAVRSVAAFAGCDVRLALPEESDETPTRQWNLALASLLEELRADAERDRSFRFRWLDEGTPRGFIAAAPLLDPEQRLLGTLLAFGAEGSPTSVSEAPRAGLALRCAAALLALSIDAARLARRGELAGSAMSFGRVAEAAVAERPDVTGIIGNSARMARLRATVHQIAQSDAGVLLLGESGTGKEVVARAIHRLSARAQSPFVAISCPSIPRELIEAQLFGHERGAFTGAHQARAGQVELADKGVLFLDEIGDVDLAVQTKLLRFLEQREFQRVGSRDVLHVDLRVLAATSRDLEEEIRLGRFREDLYYRIGVVPIQVPPLRGRTEDLPLLIAHFLRSFSDDTGRLPLEFDRTALAAMEAYDWPGNVRELRNLIEHMVALHRGRVVMARDLPAKMKNKKFTRSAPGKADDFDVQLRAGETLDARLMSVEGAILRRTLLRCQGNQAQAARLLGIKDSTLRSKLKKYRIRSLRSREEDRQG